MGPWGGGNNIQSMIAFSDVNRNQRLGLSLGPSPGFSSRGGQTTEGGATFLTYCIGCMQQPGGQTWNGGARISHGGPDTTGLWRRQGRQNVDRAGGAVKSWGQWKLMKNKKIGTKYACYCSTTMLTSKIIKGTIENVLQSGPAQGLREGVQEVHRTRAREDESTHAKFFCNQVQNWWSLSSTAALIAIFESLSMVAVSIFWLLYKQAIQISTWTQVMGPDVGLVTQGRNERARRAEFPGRRINHGGGGEMTAGMPISPKNVTCRPTFFNTVHLLPNDFRFEHGAPNLLLAPGAI